MKTAKQQQIQTVGRATAWQYHESRHADLTITCDSCGQEVKKLRQSVTDRLLAAESREGGIQAFECATCGVVIFEDELSDDRFVPYFLRASVPPHPVRTQLEEMQLK